MPLPVRDPRSEATLVRLVRAGDSEALGILFDLHGESLYRLAYRLLGHREDAEDAVQDVFGGLQLALARYEECGAFGAWLRQVTARTALMRLRAQTRRLPLTVAGSRISDPIVAVDVALQLTLDDAVAQLPDRLREVFVLRVVEGYAHHDIAGLLGISASASKVRLHRAIQRLQRALRGSL